MATEMTVEAVVTPRKPQAEAGAMAAASPPTRGGASYSANETSNNDTMVANGDLQDGSQPKEEIVADPPIVKTDRFGFTGGKQFTEDDDGYSVDVIRKREIKWLDMLDDWDKWMSKKPKKVRERCRKGIPSSIRSRAWQYLCGSKKLADLNRQRWKELDEMEGDHKWVDQISKDLNRQYPFHEMFAQRGGHGQQDLFRMLKAYSIYNPRDGYCQGQAPVAAVLLMHMPVEEAFWCFVQVCDKYLTGYYSPGLEAVQVDGMVLHGLMKKCLPAIYKHMNKHRVEPILYITEWFMCVYARTLPWKAVLRVWDMFLCEGVKVIFRVALVLLKQQLGTPQQMAESEGLYEIMEKLKNIPPQLMDDDEFIYDEMHNLHVFEKDMEAEHSLQVARRAVIKQRQQDREGQSTIMSRDIEAIQLRQKNERKSKSKAEDSPKKSHTPQKTASQKSHSPQKTASQKSHTPQKTASQKSIDSTSERGAKAESSEVRHPTVIAVKPVTPEVSPKQPIIIAVKPVTPEVSEKPSVHEGNGTMEHRGLRPGENGTPDHRVPPPLPAGVVVEEEVVQKKDKKDKKKSQKKEKKEEKEREKARLKEMKQKEKEEREKHKAQFKTAKKSGKDKDKKSSKKEKDQLSKKDKGKQKQVGGANEDISLDTGKQKQVGGANEDISSESTQKHIPTADSHSGDTLQTLETQKKEYMHLSDPSPPTTDIAVTEGNGHVSHKPDIAANVQKSEATQVSNKDQEVDKNPLKVTELTEEPVLPGVTRIVVQEADRSCITDTVEITSKTDVAETASENTTENASERVSETVPETEQDNTSCEPAEVTNVSEQAESVEVQETEGTTDLVVDKRASHIPTETDIDKVQSVDNNSSTSLQNGLHGDTVQGDVDVAHVETKVVEETDMAPTRNGKGGSEEQTIKNGVANGEETCINRDLENGEETHIDDAENVVVEDLDNDAVPKGVTAL